ncbi:MAG: hypothetical protein A2X36_12080 [Elusimicrobia bacterium GWA2_69_24]|nr:MAG: hypothetical protein A2X36_12080 [Elusimicrobia bacterium GWA2_69_24]HBL16998.1 hypothetical protein [Elusimicrobiota bacterium]
MKTDWDAAGTSRLLRGAAAINANSRFSRDIVARRCPEAASVPVVYYGAPLSVPGTEPMQPLPMPRPYILCTARLAEYKGQDVLAMAFAELVASGCDVHLVLCGADHSQGGLQSFVRALGLESRVHWVGQRPHEEVLALMRGCLFFVLPSRRESLGGALIEAMAAGKAVAASRVGGILELVRDGIEGLLVEPADVKGLTEALRRLWDDAGLRERLGRAGQVRSREFSWEAAVDAYFRDYHGLTDSGLNTAFVMWDDASDATARAYLGNLAVVMRRRALPFITCAWREDRCEPFRTEQDGRLLFRLGLPEGTVPELLNAALVLAQLWWIARTEGVAVWHVFLLRYRRLEGLLWFRGLSKPWLVVTLA